MPTLLLSARQTDDAQKLWRACIDEKWDVVRVHGWRVPEISSKDLAVYGEPLFAHHVAQSMGLQLLEPPIDWLPKLPHHWRCRDVQLTTLADARKITNRSFIKPADEKCFDARIYPSGGDLPGPGPLPEDLAVLVQEVVEWTTEFRCFILGRKLLTASPYWHNGQLAKSEDGSWSSGNDQLEDATRFCNSVLQDPTVPLSDAIALDVGIIQNRGWAVVECNAAFSSGIYGCDPVEVLHVLQRACFRLAKG
jgi:hypothetical protein